MKRGFISFWWLSQIISAALAFFDPHVGVIAALMLLPAFPMLIGLFVYPSGKEQRQYERRPWLDNDLVRGIMKVRNAIALVIVPFCALGFTAAVSIIMFLLRIAFSGMLDGVKQFIFPWNTQQRPVSNNMGILFCGIAVLLQAAAAIQYIFLLRNRRHLAQQSQQ